MAQVVVRGLSKLGLKERLSGGCFKPYPEVETTLAKRRPTLPSRIDKTDRAGAADCPCRRVMSYRIDFEIVCPNDHDQTVTFSQEEFEQTLKSGALVFHCNTCDTTWPPSHEEIVEIRKGFPKNSG